MASRTIKSTKNYRLFKLTDENRPVNLKKHRRLKESMQQYGWLRCFPMACVRNGDNHLIVKDGQHRLAFAEELGLAVNYYVEEVDFDVAKVNCTPEKWTLRDYAKKWATNGKKPYEEGLEFAEMHGLPIGTAFALLGGTTTFGNIQTCFISGDFKVKDVDWANGVASIYVALVDLSREMRNARCIEACMAVCRVDGFDAERLIKGAKRCRDKLASYSTRDAYLEMFELVYNFGRKQLVPLKINAIQAMRERNVSNVKK